MNDHIIQVPYGEFIDFVQAMADLDNIRALIKNGDDYASNGVLAILGIPNKEEEN